MSDPNEHPLHQPAVMALTGPLALLGSDAARGVGLDEILRRACAEIAAALRIEFSKVLEFLPAENALLVRAGHGWGPEVVGAARLSAELGSPAGYALKTGAPTIANDLATEDRFRVPELLRRYGVVSAVNVIIRSEELVFGVLEADSRTAHKFSAADTMFLQAYANILAMVIAQQRLAEANRRLTEHAAVLLQELRHRNKNTQQLLVSFLVLKQRGQGDPTVKAALHDVVRYVMTLNHLGDLLLDTAVAATVELAGYLEKIARALTAAEQADGPQVALRTDLGEVEVTSQQAQSSGLIVAEFIINSLKYGLNDGRGEIALSLARQERLVVIELRDVGPGIGDNAQPGTGKRLIDALAGSLAGQAEWLPGPGAGLRVTFPYEQQI